MRVRGREVRRTPPFEATPRTPRRERRLWIAARNANVPGKIAFANGKGVDTSKDAIAHCAAAIEAFAECATRLGDDPATVANDALVEAQMKAERRVVARAKVRMAWRMETLRARLETIEGERAREKTRADVAEARVASFSETVATRESATRESDRREKKALEEATRRATREASRAATLESRAATLESRVAELEHTLRASEEARASAEEARASAEEARASAERLADESRDEIRDERVRFATDINEWAMRHAETETRLEEARDDAARERDVLEEALARCASSEDAATNARAAAETFRRERDDAETAKAAAETALREGDRAASSMTARLRERLAEAEEALAAERATAAKAAAQTTALRALADRDDADKSAADAAAFDAAAKTAETNERLAAAVADAESRAAASEAAAVSTARRLDAARSVDVPREDMEEIATPR